MLVSSDPDRLKGLTGLFSPTKDETLIACAAGWYGERMAQTWVPGFLAQICVDLAVQQKGEILGKILGATVIAPAIVPSLVPVFSAGASLICAILAIIIVKIAKEIFYLCCGAVKKISIK